MASQTPASDTDQSTKTQQVSIGMPVYNGEPFIREALDSLLAQTFTDFELIISDNASTDGTEAICREYAAKDDRIRYVRQAENRGPTANFQFVLDEAVGEYFMWAAADDRWDINWVKGLIEIAAGGDCIAIGAIQIIDESGSSIRNRSNMRDLSFVGRPMSRRLEYFFISNDLGKANVIFGLISRKNTKYLQIGILGASAYASDSLMIFAALSKLSIVQNKRIILYKRLHKSAASAMSNKKETNYLKRLVNRLFFEKDLRLHLNGSEDNVERFFLIAAYVGAVIVQTSSVITWKIKELISEAKKN